MKSGLMVSTLRMTDGSYTSNEQETRQFTLDGLLPSDITTRDAGELGRREVMGEVFVGCEENLTMEELTVSS